MHLDIVLHPCCQSWGCLAWRLVSKLSLKNEVFFHKFLPNSTVPGSSEYCVFLLKWSSMQTKPDKTRPRIWLHHFVSEWCTEWKYFTYPISVQGCFQIVTTWRLWRRCIIAKFIDISDHVQTRYCIWTLEKIQKLHRNVLGEDLSHDLQSIFIIRFMPCM